MVYRRAAACVLLILLGCAGGTGEHQGRFEAAGEGGCRAVDSALAKSGWGEPLVMSGRVTLDVKQYHVQGRFRMEAPGNGNLTFEFEGTMAFGGHHEDVVLAFHEDTLRVLDRERGRFYEGDEADALVREGLDLDWNLDELIRRIIVTPPECRRLSEARLIDRGRSRTRLEGRIDGEKFRMDFEHGLVVNTSWPVVSGGSQEDRMAVTYKWRGTGDALGGRPPLRGLVAFLEGRRWRVKLDSE
jgi:hypothetical protein